MSPRILELYAGIGGVAATGADVVAAIDHDVYAHTTYTANFDHPAHRINLVSIRPERLLRFGADAWWMSPPCQPFTVRGARRDVEDRRAESFLHLLGILEEHAPDTLFVENVPGFEGSVAHARLRHALRDHHTVEVEWCPSQLGYPVQRRRFYLVASRTPVQLTLPERPERRALASFLDADVPAHCELEPAFLERYADALHVVDADDPEAEAVCFTGAYGRSPVYAGSYLRQDGRLRRFSPAEVARLQGLPEGFVLPGAPSRAYRLLGNSLAVPVVRRLLHCALGATACPS